MDADTSEKEQYPPIDDIDFSILANDWRSLALFEDDLFLGMQGMNVGITDPTITSFEYETLHEYLKRERTPTQSAMQLSAFSQMWILALYEVMRIWRDRVYNYGKWHQSGGLSQALKNLQKNDGLNSMIDVKRSQIEQYRDDDNFRIRVEKEWSIFMPTFRQIELLRINLAKHVAPGKNSIMARAPGYARINMICGSMDYEVIDGDGNYFHINRRSIADALRGCFNEVNEEA